MRVQTKTEEETLVLGNRLARILRFGEVLALLGDLGAGKTVLSRGIARGLGIVEAVTSPTFTVVQEYPLPTEKGGFFFHLDMYRIDDERAALAFGIEDFLFAPDAVTVVEWPERIWGLLKERAFCLALHHLPDGGREIEIPDSLAMRWN